MGAGPSKEGLWQYFVNKSANNLHVVLGMSPVGDTLRTRCRNFPGEPTRPAALCCSLSLLSVSALCLCSLSLCLCSLSLLSVSALCLCSLSLLLSVSALCLCLCSLSLSLLSVSVSAALCLCWRLTF